MTFCPECKHVFTVEQTVAVGDDIYKLPSHNRPGSKDECDGSRKPGILVEMRAN
jgi:hypothetical protein